MRNGRFVLQGILKFSIFPNCGKYPKLVFQIMLSQMFYVDHNNYILSNLQTCNVVTELFWNTFLVNWSICLLGAKPTLINISDLQPHCCLTLMDVNVGFKLYSFRDLWGRYAQIQKQLFWISERVIYSLSGDTNQSDVRVQ